MTNRSTFGKILAIGLLDWLANRKELFSIKFDAYKG